MAEASQRAIQKVTDAIKDNELPVMFLLGEKYIEALSTLITYYTKACVDQENLETFADIVQEFYYPTIPDGYEALYALRDLFEPGTDKRQIIDILIAEHEEGGDNIKSTDSGANLH